MTVDFLVCIAEYTADNGLTLNVSKYTGYSTTNGYTPIGREVLYRRQNVTITSNVIRVECSSESDTVYSLKKEALATGIHFMQTLELYKQVRYYRALIAFATQLDALDNTSVTYTHVCTFSVIDGEVRTECSVIQGNEKELPPTLEWKSPTCAALKCVSSELIEGFGLQLTEEIAANPVVLYYRAYFDFITSVDPDKATLRLGFSIGKNCYVLEDGKQVEVPVDIIEGRANGTLRIYSTRPDSVYLSHQISEIRRSLNDC